MSSRRVVVVAALLVVLAMAPVFAAGQSEPQDDEVVTFTAIFDFNVDPKGMSLKDNEYIDYLQEQTGVRMEIESPGSAGYVEKINVLMASGSYPDLFTLYAGDRNTILRFAQDELLADLAPYVNDTENYPNTRRYMPAEAFLPVTQDGQIWAYPYNRQDGKSQVVYINKVWLDNLGLEVPRTLDEYYEVLRAFTFDDPDGNGRDDTFGLLLSPFYGKPIFRAAFDAQAYRVVDGKVTPPEITDGYRSYLEFVARLVEEGIADPEFPTFTTPIYLQKLSSGSYGMTTGFWHFARGTEVDADTISEFISIPPPLRPDGSQSTLSYEGTNRHFVVVPNTTPNLDRLMDFLDWGVGPEGTKFTYLGIPGVHYEEQAGGTIVATDEPAPLHWAFSLVKQGQLTEEVQGYLSLKFNEASITNLGIANEYGVVDPIATALPFYPELASFNLTKIVEEYELRTLLGNDDIDSTWDAYVNRWRTAGGDRAIEFWTEWYNTQN